MKKHALAGVAWLLPSTALASDPTALYYFFALQGFSWVWPFILPLFYLKGVRSRLRLYLVLLLLPLGVLELADVPWSILYGIAAWGIYDFPDWLTGYIVNGRHLLAICLSLWFMPRLRRLVLNGLGPGYSPQPGAAADRTATPRG